MKIVNCEKAEEEKNKQFLPGHIYKSVSGSLYFCADTKLISLIDGSGIYPCASYRPSKFKDVTDCYELREVCDE